MKPFKLACIFSLLILANGSHTFSQLGLPTDTITSVQWEEVTFNFGDINDVDSVSHTYYFTNTGRNPLEVISVKPTCGCTAGKFSMEPVPPGEKGFVELKFSPKGKEGIIAKTATVKMNTEPSFHSLQFGAKIITTPDLDFGVDSIYHFDSDTTLPNIDWNNSDIIADDWTNWDFSSQKDIAEMKADSLYQAYYYTTNGLVEWEEKNYDFGKVSQKQIVKYVYSFTNTGAVPVKINAVLPSVEGIVCKYSKKAVLPGKSGSVELIFNPGVRQGIFKDVVVIMMNTIPAYNNLSFKVEVE